MQFYLDGYAPGDPDILAAAPDAEARSLDLPETVDVLIVGAGPAGMLLAAQLSGRSSSRASPTASARSRWLPLVFCWARSRLRR